MESAQRKKNNLLLVLSSIFITNAVVAELIGVKLFSLEKTLGFAPVQWKLFSGHILDFNLTAGVLIWPVVFITTDIINEYFGVKGVRRISIITTCLILYVFLVISIVTTFLQPAPFWLQINNVDSHGNPFDIQYAFNTIFRQGLGIMLGSVVAFLVGQFLDMYIFHQLKKATGNKKIWLRATGSTLVSQLLDSFVVLTIAFYWFGNWSWSQLVSVAIINYIYKLSIAILLTPLLYVAHLLIDRYLGHDSALRLTKRSMEQN